MYSQKERTQHVYNFNKKHKLIGIMFYFKDDTLTQVCPCVNCIYNIKTDQQQVNNKSTTASLSHIAI